MNNFFVFKQLNSPIKHHRMYAINPSETIKLFLIEKQEDKNSFKQEENKRNTTKLNHLYRLIKFNKRYLIYDSRQK